MGGILTSDPDCHSESSAFGFGEDRIDVVVRGGESRIYPISYVNGAWGGWQDLGVY